EGPDDVGCEGRVDHIEDRRIEKHIESDKKHAAGGCGDVGWLLRPRAHDSSAPVKPLRLRLIERPATRITINEARNRKTPMAEPSAQVPVSPNCSDRLMPKEVACGPPRKRWVTAEARHGMKTSTSPITVPIQLSGQVISMKARQGRAPLILAT